MTDLAPDITAVEIVRHDVLGLTFADGIVGDLDVLDPMRGRVFDQARTRRGGAPAQEESWR